MKTRKTFALLSATLLAITMFTGCGAKSPEQEAAEAAAMAQNDRLTLELRQNDYRGGLTRMGAVQNNILNTMELMKSNNKIIRQDSPNSFWTAEGYQDFVATFLDTPLIPATIWFNEEEGDWATTMSMMCSEKNIFTKENDGAYVLACTIDRNEKDDYLVTNLNTSFTTLVNGRAKVYDSNASQCRVLYDCDKDWCKSYVTQMIDEEIPDVTTAMVEYMRIDDNTFAVQTSRERLMVVLKPAESDTDLREREIKEFYYSKLVQEGMRTTFEPYIALPEIDEAMGEVLKENAKKNEKMETFKGFNEKGDFAMLYGQNDSVFYRSPSEITPENFVFEDKSLQQAICYKDGVLVVTTYNKLSAAYERFTYAMKNADGKIADSLEKMVAINKLVGVQEVPEVEAPEVEVKGDKNKDKDKDKDKDNSEEVKENETENITTEEVTEEITSIPETSEENSEIEVPAKETST